MKISIISIIPKTENKFIKGLLGILTVIIYPIILIFGLVFMLFAGLLSIFQRIFSNDPNNIENKSQETEAISNDWSIMTKLNGLEIYKKFEGEIRFGPIYMSLTSQPNINGFHDKIFGDWFYPYKNGLFLQQWNSTDLPNTNLIYLDSEIRKFTIVKSDISSVLWDMIENENNKLELTCDTGKEIYKYELEPNDFQY